MKEKLKNAKGITLIALIITIIVLLILAVVSIKLVWDGGIIAHSKNATSKYTVEQEKELIALGYSEYKMAKINNDQATLTVKEAQVEGTGPWTITFNKTQNQYTLDINGNITENGTNGGGTNTPVDLEAAKQKLIENPNEFTHPEQSTTNKDRAVGTDGKAVNMDLWKTRIVNEEKREIALSNYDGSTGNGPAYANENIKEGKIQGSIPQYIYLQEKNKIYTVTDLASTFTDCTNLTQAPTIPNTVTDMYATFNRCTNLTQAPAIPNDVTNMSGTFMGCTSLTQAPAIPSSVTDMSSTFGSCTNLTQAPAIPNDVTNMSWTFIGCTSLTQAPEIPNSVTFMNQTFDNCTNLTGIIKINSSNISSYVGSCFNGITNNLTVQVPVGSTTYNTFNSAYGSASNITIQTF